MRRTIEEALTELVDLIDDGSERTQERADALTNEILEIHKAEKIEWVPCSEKLPEKNGDCLVTIGDVEVYKYRTDNNTFEYIEDEPDIEDEPEPQL